MSLVLPWKNFLSVTSLLIFKYKRETSQLCFSFYILLFWEAPLLRHRGAFHILGMHFIVTKTDKFIWYSQTGKELYFDLVNDPHESHNAIDEEQNAI